MKVRIDFCALADFLTLFSPLIVALIVGFFSTPSVPDKTNHQARIVSTNSTDEFTPAARNMVTREMMKSAMPSSTRVATFGY